MRLFLLPFHPSSGAQGPLCLARYAICPTEPPRGLHTCASHARFLSLCSQVEFSADTLRLNMIDLGRTGSKLLTVAGTLDFMCQEVEAADPVTFTTKDSHLVSNLILIIIKDQKYQFEWEILPDVFHTQPNKPTKCYATIPKSSCSSWGSNPNSI